MAEAPPWAPSDPLGEALHFLRLSGAFYCRSELTVPWGLTIPSMRDCLWFHVVTEGHAWLELDGEEPIELRPGDLALVPHGRGHRLVSAAGVAAPLVDRMPQEMIGDRYSLLRHGGGGAPSTLVCGAVRFEDPAADRLVALLPSCIQLSGRSAPHLGWLESTLRLMADEARTLRAGGLTVITRLADILVIQALRSWIEQTPLGEGGWLAALRDRQVGRAITLVHRDPAHPWTLASLASAVAMSRSAFAARFTALAGEPAMQYVTRWRMHVAVTRLRDEGATPAELAGALGYQSEAAFRRAFKRFVGRSPGAVRRAG